MKKSLLTSLDIMFPIVHLRSLRKDEINALQYQDSRKRPGLEILCPVFELVFVREDSKTQKNQLPPAARIGCRVLFLRLPERRVNIDESGLLHVVAIAASDLRRISKDHWPLEVMLWRRHY